jgi:AraC-like DNA-binding protein
LVCRQGNSVSVHPNSTDRLAGALKVPYEAAHRRTLAQNYERPDIIAELVRRSGLPKRTFDRRFRRRRAIPPLAYVQALRIEEAKHSLETGSAPVEVVGREVGYEGLASFRRLFRRLAGMTPGDYHRKFKVPSLVERAASQREPRLLLRDEDVPAQRAPETTETGVGPAS